MTCMVIDFGMGNLGSVARSLEECGADVTITSDPSTLKKATKIVLPGVGAFADGMHNLHEGGWVEVLNSLVVIKKTPLLGICLGMQLLADSGHEGDGCKGLGFISGDVVRLIPENNTEKIPHVGWNEVHILRSNSLFEAIPDRSDFYFVHSYHFVVKKKEQIIAQTPYCRKFAAAIMAENIFGVQFHPEKSSKYGFNLLRNFIGL